MNICLINPRGLNGPNVSLPHGLLSLCATLKQAGHDCRIIDACAPDAEAELSNLKQYDAAGISAITTQLAHGADIARTLPRGGRADIRARQIQRKVKIHAFLHRAAEGALQ